MFYFNSVQEGLDYLFTDEFGNNNVTTLHIEGSNEPWFYASQIAECLGYRGRARDIIKRLPENMAAATICRVNLIDGRVQDREVLILSLTGLLWVVGASRAPRADKFKEWVYGVLVVGLYNHPEIVRQLNNEHKKQMCHIVHNDSSEYRIHKDNNRLYRENNCLMNRNYSIDAENSELYTRIEELEDELDYLYGLRYPKNYN